MKQVIDEVNSHMKQARCDAAGGAHYDSERCGERWERPLIFRKIEREDSCDEDRHTLD